jgi:hypothetical protein
MIIREFEIPLQRLSHREKISKEAGHVKRPAELMDLTDM